VVRVRFIVAGLLLAGMLAAFSDHPAWLTPARAAVSDSGITAVAVAGIQSAGVFDGVPYTRTWGTVSGVVGPVEHVVGIAALPKDANGDYDYSSQFELIAPTAPGTNSAILVEAENRGTPLVLDGINALAIHGPPAEATYAVGLGNGFLETHHTSYARVQWETHISAGVPANAQGVGEVIVRDFARMLAGDRGRMAAQLSFDPGRYRSLLIGGISQSAWFVDTFIAEGFNVDPVSQRSVFSGAIAIDGTGNWLALNQLAAANGASESAYVVPTGAPIPARQLLRRPRSDPFYIDVANYTDFYRVRASLTDTSSLPGTMRRYDWPSPHHPVLSAKDAAGTFAASRAGGPCNTGVVVPLNPIAYFPYLRTLVIELEGRVGAQGPANVHALPPTTLFTLGAVPASTADFNGLPGATLEVPLTDADAQPVGGVRFPEVDHPVGRPLPVSLPPVITTAITGICGNNGQWQPLTAAELATRYGSQTKYVSVYGDSLDRLIAGGYLLPSEKEGLLTLAAARYQNPAGY